MHWVMRQTCTASPGLLAGRHSPIRAEARPRPAAVGVLLAVIVAAVGLVIAHEARAQEATPLVTIEAVHPTALQGIDNLVFTVTRSVASGDELEVPVTLSSGIIAADQLSQTATIAENEASVELRVSTDSLDPDATTGDVTATVGDGDGYDVGDPSTATVRVHVGETLVTVRFDAGSYSVDEDVGTTTDEINLVAQTESGVPAPTGDFRVVVTAQAGTAGPDDVLVDQTVQFGEAAGHGWAADGDVRRSVAPVELTISDDALVEGDETLELIVASQGTPGTVRLVQADSTACGADGCTSTLTIVDNDGEVVNPNTEHSGDVTIEACTPPHWRGSTTWCSPSPARWPRTTTWMCR